ncbi:MAG TPA: YhbY family RNA-binding protein [Candidatus Nanoarchaeia archaeon]|nr:YhbY family RNA-binding protein [Candidatus Nanoarchaeia archaeon]
MRRPIKDNDKVAADAVTYAEDRNMLKINPKRRRFLRAHFNTQDVDLRVGKSGITQGFIGELKLQLEKREIVKVKLLKSAIGESDNRKMFGELAAATGAEIIKRTGLTVTLHKKRQLQNKFRK